MDRLLVLLLVVALTGLVSAWWRRRDGRVDAIGTVPTGSGDERWDALPVEAADIAAALDTTTPLVLVEFTTPDCHPCVTTRGVLADAVADRPDVAVAELDVAQALDLARAHRVLTAPTTMLITRQGHLLGRVAGVPRRDELDALLRTTAPRPAGQYTSAVASERMAISTNAAAPPISVPSRKSSGARPRRAAQGVHTTTRPPS